MYSEWWPTTSNVDCDIDHKRRGCTSLKLLPTHCLKQRANNTSEKQELCNRWETLTIERALHWKKLFKMFLNPVMVLRRWRHQDGKAEDGYGLASPWQSFWVGSGPVRASKASRRRMRVRTHVGVCVRVVVPRPAHK